MRDSAPELSILRAEARVFDGQLVLADTQLAVGGEGRLAGSLPLSYRAGALAIDRGRLLATSPGHLRLVSSEAEGLLEPAGASTALLLGALADFRYRELAAELDKTYEGEARFRLKLAGANPAFRAGQTFNVNLDLSTSLDRLVAPLLAALRSSDAELAERFFRR